MLELKNVSKTYGENGRRIEVVDILNLSVENGTFVALIGPSGCGKSTLLKIVAGLTPATSGEIMLDGERITRPGKDRGLVFQQFTLFPWLTVRGNISFGLDLQKLDDKKKAEVIEHYLNVTRLADFAEFYPKQLSGGMQQRVAIARTLASNPKILLMDEPFGALDSQTRSRMQEFLTSLWETEKHTILFVTHDVQEAAFLADKVYVLTKRPTEIKQVFDVPFPRPRLHALKRAKEFFEFENAVARELES